MPLVCDMSSDILSRPVDVSKFGIVYAGAQKNMAPAGLTVVIIREDLAGHELPYTPLMMNYKTMIDKDSMYNTPPSLVHLYAGAGPGLAGGAGGRYPAWRPSSTKRTQMLYDVIDSSRLFTCAVEPGSRSDMNVVFRTGSDELDAQVCAGERGRRFHQPGRATAPWAACGQDIYNAMPTEGVEKLCDFIKAFDRAELSPAARPRNQAFCRRQNLDAGRIYSARADKIAWGPAKWEILRAGRHAGVYLQRHAHRGRGKAVRLHPGIR